MPQLSEARLFHPRVPASLAPLLDDLAALAALLHDPRPVEERRAEAAPLYERATAVAERELRHQLPDSLRADDPAHVAHFCEAVLLWPHWAAVAGRPRYDSLRSPSLAAFACDLPLGVSARGPLRAALKRAMGVGDLELDRAQDVVDRLVANLAVKHAIASHVADALAAAGDPTSARCGWMRRIYGDHGWLPGEVDLVITWSHIFFCLPYSGTRHAAWEGLDPQRRAKVGAFLEAVHDQNSFVTRRFPAFGIYDPDAVDEGMLDELWASVRAQPDLGGVPRQVVVDTLQTMVSIAPTAGAEQYLVHDAWGHAWQEALCDFEWLYDQLSHILDPIDAATGARAGLPADRRLASAFADRGGVTVVDRDTLLQIAEQDIRHRIRCAHHAHTSEVLADLVEHKYVRQIRGTDAVLPTSSLLPDQATKLDLSLGDAMLHAAAWGAAWKRFFAQPEQRAALVAELVASGLPAPGLVEAVDEAAALVHRQFAAAWATTWADRWVDEAGAKVAVHERMGLQAAAMGAELNALLTWGERVWEAQRASGWSRWQVPESSLDLIVLLIAWQYEQDPDAHVWHLDAYVRALPPTLARLGDALRGPDQAPAGGAADSA